MSQAKEISITDGAASQALSRPSILLRAVEVWLIVSVVEILHGIARITFLQPLVGDFQARQIAVFSGSVLIVATTLVFKRWLSARSAPDCLFIGAVWVMLTLGFEFGFGRLVLDLSWERLLSDYNLIQGGLMPIGLLVMFLSPLIALRIGGD